MRKPPSPGRARYEDVRPDEVLRILSDPEGTLKEEWEAANREGFTGRAVLKALLVLATLVAILVVYAVFGIEQAPV